MMPGLHATAFNQPKDWQAFERLVRDLAALLFEDPHADLHGRSGQRQNGVDIFCRDRNGEPVGIQCKHVGVNVDQGRLSIMLAAEIEKAKTFEPPLRQFILVTNTSNDVELQGAARRASEAHQAEGLFTVEVHGWDWIEGLLCRWPEIAVQYGLVLQPLASAPISGVAKAIAARFNRLVEMINAGRSEGEAIGLTDIARALAFLDWRELEALAQGLYAGDLDRLVSLSEGLGVCSDWLVHGRSAPFRVEGGAHDTRRQCDEILARRPQCVFVVRSRAALQRRCRHARHGPSLDCL